MSFVSDKLPFTYRQSSPFSQGDCRVEPPKAASHVSWRGSRWTAPLLCQEAVHLVLESRTACSAEPQETGARQTWVPRPILLLGFAASLRNFCVVQMRGELVGSWGASRDVSIFSTHASSLKFTYLPSPFAHGSPKLLLKVVLAPVSENTIEVKVDLTTDLP